ncbi:MBL fold metallo-hydrolase [Janthinobacterium sp. FT14W]|uniref:MBL fold metallo-hydrolase n=1 Tax=Janthinobacterium sp. FT14W TaxID=2654253 RepID=UPI00126470AE|nr:MBL fold metallo-hydrolase [Janthinobacterium sp. FT14W]KAB8061477.1 MBL fold metallo-hydrolase [Janthinobacterium sp. FT14W]
MEQLYGAAANVVSRPQVVVLKMQFQFMTNYNYLIIDSATRQAVIVDPAWEMLKVETALEEAQVQLAGILITHSHPDHLNLAAPLAAAMRCPIWMSNSEIAVSGFRNEWLVGIDTAPWYVGGMQIQPLHTPGHTPGCFCYLIGDNLFTGDVLFAEGCGMCPDIEAAHKMYASLEYLKALLEPHMRVYPGHSYGKVPGQRFDQVMQDNIYLQFSDVESFTKFRMRKVQSRISMFGQ